MSTLESMHAWQRSPIDATSVLKNAWGIPFQILTSARDMSGIINGCDAASHPKRAL